MPNVSRFI